MKTKSAELQTLGAVVVHKNKVKLHWGGQDGGDNDDEKKDDEEDDDDADDEEEMPKAFKKLITKEKGTKTGCATTSKEMKLLHEDDDQAAHVLVSEMDDTEWWTMVSSLEYYPTGLAVQPCNLYFPSGYYRYR